MAGRTGALFARAAGGLAFAVFFIALTLRGASEAPLAAAFALALALLAAAAIAAAPHARLLRALRANWITALAALAFVCWCLATAWIGGAETPAFWRASWHPLWNAFGLEGGAVTLSPYRTIEGVAAFLAPAAAFLLGALNVQSRAERDWTGRLYAALAIAFAVFALIMLIEGVGLRWGRLTARLGSSNAAATIFGVFALFMTALVIRATRGRLTGGRIARAPTHPLLAWAGVVQGAPITFAALVLVGACALLTGSRAGILVSAGALMICIALLRAPASAGDGRDARSNAASLLLGAIALLLLLLGGGDVFARFGEVDADSVARRIMIETHWLAFLDRPWLGHGLNTFHELNAHYGDPANWAALESIGSAHNIFVQMLEETGVIGAGFFLAMLAPPIWRALRIAWTDRSGAEWAAASVSATLLCFGHGAVDFGLQVPALSALLAYALGAFSRIEDGAARVAESRRITPAEPAIQFRTLDP